MPALPKFEVASGAIDGVNTVFTVSSAYQPGTTAVFLNGQLKRKDFSDGWIETSPAAGVVTLDEAPLDADVVQVFFIDASGANQIEVEEVCPLLGKLASSDDLLGRLQTVQAVTAKAEASGDLSGTMLTSGAISATLEDSEQLHGILSEVCE